VRSLKFPKATLLSTTALLIYGLSFSSSSLAKTALCKVLRPPGVDSKVTADWRGDCKNGTATGLGVARYLNGGKVETAFYGQVKDGAWEFGVYDTNSGYIAGHFKDNQLVPSDDRNVTIQAFETASKAATELSKKFEKQGNKASAKYYKDVAGKLAGQMD
jgi:hypothetical protein